MIENKQKSAFHIVEISTLMDYNLIIENDDSNERMRIEYGEDRLCSVQYFKGETYV